MVTSPADRGLQFVSMRGSRKFCQKGSNFDNGFLVEEGREDSNTIIAYHHRPASETPFKWNFAGVSMMVQH